MLSLTLIPPSPVSRKIDLEIRSSALDQSRANLQLLWDGQVIAEGRSYLELRRSMQSEVGNHQIKLRRLDSDGTIAEEVCETLVVLDSPERSSRMLGGAWNGFYHWSEEEGKFWNSHLAQFTAEDWRNQMRDMHSVGLDLMVIQETFRSPAYFGKHSMALDGYCGKAYYPSQLTEKRVENLLIEDPLEAVLDEADALGMKIFPGVGLYAWFDFTESSLEWHMQAAEELFRRYGHHRSFYGFYVSEEIGGDLGNLHSIYTPAKQVICFFEQFRKFCRNLAPDKPLMLAPNSFHFQAAEEDWEALLQHLDIVCPFGFHRMDTKDLSGHEAAVLMQKIADRTQRHLWMDMELFCFDQDNALYPRPMEDLLRDMEEFDNFEKILGYQYGGMMSSPSARIAAGGERAIELYCQYRDFYQKRYSQMECSS